ncbi:MAG: hypothetical protein LUG95_00485 [Clostridiales bacterium]|nr:hypothetical protein [Clostridiales bacterium]
MSTGTAVTYYNTKTFGFDENATVFSHDDKKFTFLDFEIYYSDIETFFTSAKKYLPTDFTAVDI